MRPIFIRNTHHNSNRPDDSKNISNCNNNKQDDYTTATKKKDSCVSFPFSFPSSPNNSNKNNVKSYSSDLIVFLDLDKTLIYTELKSVSPTEKVEKIDSEADNADNDIDNGIDNRMEEENDNHFMTRIYHHETKAWYTYTVHKRPHLDSFLQEITSQFETHIFTAACKDYAEPILDKLDPNNTMFANRYYRESCTMIQNNTNGSSTDVDQNNYHSYSCYTDIIKDVQSLELDNSNKKGGNEQKKEEVEGSSNTTSTTTTSNSINIKRFVIIDDNETTMIKNINNGIPVREYINSIEQLKNDRVLLDVQTFLVEELADKSKDVRIILKKKFQLEKYLAYCQNNNKV